MLKMTKYIIVRCFHTVRGIHSCFRKYYFKITWRTLTQWHSKYSFSNFSSLQKNIPEYPEEKIEKNAGNLVIQDFNKTTNLDELNRAIEEHKGQLSINHAYQALERMCTLKRDCFHIHKWPQENAKRTTNCEPSEYVINILKDASVNLTNDMLISCLKNLNLLNYSGDWGNLITECENRLEMFPLESISNIFTYLPDKHLFYYLNIQKKLLNLMNKYILKCDNEFDLKSIATCFNYLTIAGSGLKQKIILKIEDMLKNNKLQDFKGKLASLKILFSPPYNKDDKDLIENLCELLQHDIDDLGCEDLIELHSVIRHQALVDTFNFFRLISSRGVSLLDELNPIDQLKVLICLTDRDITTNSDKLIALIENTYRSMCFVCHGAAFLKVMQVLERLESPILKEFWNISTKFFGENKFEFFICRNYINFKLAFWGGYHHKNFENSLKPVLMERLNKYLLPKHVALICVFFIVSNGTSNLTIPPKVLYHMEALMKNFSPESMYLIADSIRTIRPRFISNKSLLHQMNRILDSITEEALLRSSDVRSLQELCNLTSASLAQKHTTNECLVDNFLDQHLRFANELTSKTVLTISNNISNVAYYNPDLINQIAQYVVNHKTTGWTVASVLFACYRSGCYPNVNDNQLAYLIEIIDKYKNHMIGLKFLHSALALSLFHHLPSSWVTDIFSLTFLDKLDEEIKGSWTPNYATRIKQHLMEINRVACIEYPDLNIPWFHGKMNNVNIIEYVPESEFHKEVEESLLSLFGSKKFFVPHVYSPYWYYISFECIMDSMKNMVIHPGQTNEHHFSSRGQTTVNTPEGCQKIAINIHKENAFCINVRNLVGGQQLKRRHLEILEYKIVDIPYYEWYSLSLSDTKSRLSYLKKKIFS